MLLASGALLLLVLLLLHLLWTALSRVRFAWGSLSDVGCCCARAARGKSSSKGELHWPAENAKFSHVTAYSAPSVASESGRVRVYHSGGEGQREVLVLESDVDESCLANCKGPMEMLLYVFGLKTVRQRVKRKEFEKLEKKQHAIVGKANVSYSPEFMPRYEAAFSLLSGRRPLSSRPRSRTFEANEGHEAPPPAVGLTSQSCEQASRISNVSNRVSTYRHSNRWARGSRAE